MDGSSRAPRRKTTAILSVGSKLTSDSPCKRGTRRRTYPIAQLGLVIRLGDLFGQICLSGCGTGQLAHNDCDPGLTFTKVGIMLPRGPYQTLSGLTMVTAPGLGTLFHHQCFLDVMAQDPNITWVGLHDALK